MAEPWKDRLAALGQGLLTLEINTVVTEGLSAQKMPEVPLALHILVQVYGDYLTQYGFQVSTGLRNAAARRVGGSNNTGTEDADLLRQLKAWPFKDVRVFNGLEQAAGLETVSQAISDASTPAEREPATDLTNGGETFEALNWAAWAALQTLSAGATLPRRSDSLSAGATPKPPDRSILLRINANCRQLREAALRLEQQHAPSSTAESSAGGQPLLRSSERVADRLKRMRGESAASSNDKPTSRLFGATEDETARALFAHPRPVFACDPDVTVLIRKAWDIGIQQVKMQTVIQVDGDVLLAMDNLGADREFLTALHRTAVQDSLAQWRAMFDVIRQLAEDVGKLIFGSFSAAK